MDDSHVMILGDSAGGNLAAAVSHSLAAISERHCKIHYLKAQVCLLSSRFKTDVSTLKRVLPGTVTESTFKYVVCKGSSVV